MKAVKGISNTSTVSHKRKLKRKEDNKDQDEDDCNEEVPTGSAQPLQFKRKQINACKSVVMFQQHRADVAMIEQQRARRLSAIRTEQQINDEADSQLLKSNQLFLLGASLGLYD
jgi:hypothetical protein